MTEQTIDTPRLAVNLLALCDAVASEGEALQRFSTIDAERLERLCLMAEIVRHKGELSDDEVEQVVTNSWQFIGSVVYAYATTRIGEGAWARAVEDGIGRVVRTLTPAVDEDVI